MQDKIKIKGAREHNLKNISLEIPRNKMTVFTGLSGSGKSSLAFDTIFAEGQRRYVESLSAYARQFLGQMQKPDVDEIEGLSPAISIDQKAHSRNPRSTVATITEIYDYLRVLFARTGKPHCVICQRPIQRLTVAEMVDLILAASKGEELRILAPVIRGRKGEYYQLLYNLYNSGFAKARIDGKIFALSGKTRSLTLSAKFSCPHDGFAFSEIEPRLFSFNSPYGACSACDGLGTKELFSEEVCDVCHGARLRPEGLHIWVQNTSIVDITAMNIAEAHAFFESLRFDEKIVTIAENVLNEVTSRLQFMLDVGLNYLTLDRRSGTLSGGEAQRIRLASQIGSRLVGALYVLD